MLKKESIVQCALPLGHDKFFYWVSQIDRVVGEKYELSGTTLTRGEDEIRLVQGPTKILFSNTMTEKQVKAIMERAGIEDNTEEWFNKNRHLYDDDHGTFNRLFKDKFGPIYGPMDISMF